MRKDYKPLRRGIEPKFLLIRRQTTAVLAAILLLAAGVNAQNDDVLPPGARVAGKTIGQWTGEWWKTALEAVDNPFDVVSGQTGTLGDVGGPVFFAVASPALGSTTLKYTVPRNQYVLFPLYTYMWASQSSADPCSDFACAHELADSFVKAVDSLAVTIDGRPVRGLFRHYESTPRFFRATVPVDGWWAAGDPSAAGRWFGFSSGYWLMLEPLSPGVHVLSIAVSAPFSSVCADGSDSCAIPEPGPNELSKTRLILRACDDGDRGSRDRCGD